MILLTSDCQISLYSIGYYSSAIKFNPQLWLILMQIVPQQTLTQMISVI